MGTLDGDGWLDDGVIDAFCLALVSGLRVYNAAVASFSAFWRDVMAVYPEPAELRSQMGALQFHVPKLWLMSCN